MKILVTGGAGFIGSVTTKKLLDKGHEVVVYDSLIKGHRESVDSRAEFVQGCLSDKSLLDKTFKKFGIEAVIHFAGFIEAGESMKEPSKFFKNNVIYGLNLLDVMAKNNVKKIIFSSSAAVYASKDSPLEEEDIKKPANFYGETKLIFEKLLSWYDDIYQIKFVALRYFNAAGACGELVEKHNPETHLIPLVIFTALGKRESIKIFGTDYSTPDGTGIRDYVDVKDLAEAHILALENLRETSNAYNVGTGKGISVKEVVEAVKKISGKDFNVIEAEKREGDPTMLVANSEKIKKELGWEAKVNFEEGLRETFEYFKNS
ncbi:UDP-glucose 4-epimerase GalE [Candidatus Pacearchaeota archaeon]|nr:UDP-glucose 4-epimerase GalE [Candidatus Pacearchaeota archaeon]|tara:strand:- start:948 stop:1901 length:954 start_codon:yes stop_codon:yes gene_type:complete